VEVPEEKKVNIETFYLTEEVDIWWNTVKDRLLVPKFTWNKFLEELRVKFYPTIVQQQNINEYMELNMTASMTIMQYASRFMKLFGVVLKFLSSKKLQMRGFGEVLVFDFHSQLVVNQSIPTKK